MHAIRTPRRTPGGTRSAKWIVATLLVATAVFAAGAASSCIGCHSGATLAVCSKAGCAAGPTTPASADFSLLLGEAQ